MRPVSEDADRHVSRECSRCRLVLPAFASGDILPSASVASSTDVAAGVGTRAVAGAPSSQGSHLHASPPVAPQGLLVSHGRRPSQSDPSVTGVHRGGTLVAPEDSGCPGFFFRSLLVPVVGSDSLGGLDRGRKRGAHQCARGEGSITGSSCLEPSGQSVVLMSNNALVVAYFRHRGGTVPRVLCLMASEISMSTKQHLVRLLARYIPG